MRSGEVFERVEERLSLLTQRDIRIEMFDQFSTTLPSRWQSFYHERIDEGLQKNTRNLMRKNSQLISLSLFESEKKRLGLEKTLSSCMELSLNQIKKVYPEQDIREKLFKLRRCLFVSILEAWHKKEIFSGVIYSTLNRLGDTSAFLKYRYDYYSFICNAYGLSLQEEICNQMTYSLAPKISDILKNCDSVLSVENEQRKRVSRLTTPFDKRKKSCDSALIKAKVFKH